MINAEGAPAANIDEQTDGRSNRGRLILAGAGVVIAASSVAEVMVPRSAIAVVSFAFWSLPSVAVRR